MNVLVACEYSGTVRDAFIRAGHHAISIDLLPSESDFGMHIQGNIYEAMEYIDPRMFDLIVAHIPCTRFCNSGVRWYHERPEYKEEMMEMVELWNFCWNLPIEKKCFENPIPHKYAVEYIGKPTQYIQPYEYGHPETKKTGLWLKNLPPLEPTNIVEGREARVHKMAPGPNRAKERSRFFSGVAEAMVNRWS